MMRSGERPRDFPFRVTAVILAIAVVFLVITLWPGRPRLSEQEVRDVVFSTIQREAAAAFLVTGYIDVTAATQVENTRTLLPGIVNLDLGTTSANVRVPGRISYGFDVSQLRPEMIRLVDGNTVEVDVPDPVIWSVEPDLSQLEVETRRGWLRLAGTEERVRERAIELLQPTLRAQGQRHLAGSEQPRINTADALQAMLHPVLIAAGMQDPQIRVRIGRLTIEPAQS